MRCHHSSSPPPLGTDQPGAGQFMLISLALLLTGHDHQTGPAVVPAVFHVSVASVTAFFFFFGQFVILFAFCLFCFVLSFSFSFSSSFSFFFVVVNLQLSPLSPLGTIACVACQLERVHTQFSGVALPLLSLSLYFHLAISPFLYHFYLTLPSAPVLAAARVISTALPLWLPSPSLPNSLSRFPLTGHT